MGKRIEDYIEVIYDLSDNRGYTRIKDISSRLNVKPASASEMVSKLHKRGYIIYEKRLFVALTEKGKQLALDVRNRREILIKFLNSIGVPPEVSERDACIIEHELDNRTVEQLNNFVKFIEESPVDKPKWLRHFKEFCEKGVHPCTVAKGQL